MLDLIIRNGSCYIDKNLKDQDIAIKDGKIIKIGKIESEAKGTFDAEGLIVLPGCIDTQTHFREPGSTDTEDLYSGSRAAIVGGITSVFEMPNTNPPTSTKVEFQKKLDLAKNRMYCNYAFYFGATADNANELADLVNLEGCCGIKLFAGSST
jgi:dihydroorotase